MIRPIILVFLILSAAFAAMHHMAVLGSLYYYYWWLDIPMHFFGGVLIALGLYAGATFRFIQYRPTLTLLLWVLLAVTLAWELFEWQVDLYDIETPFLEAGKDMLVAFVGGLLAHSVLRRYTIKI